MNPPLRLPNIPTPNSVLKNISVQPSSSAPPVSRVSTLPLYTDAVGIIDTLWANTKSVYNDAYKVGKSYYGIEPDAAYVEFLSAFITLFFSNIKEQVLKDTPNMEEQQAKLLHLNAIRKAIESNITILKNFEFNVDKTQLIAMLNGYSITQTAGIHKK